MRAIEPPPDIFLNSVNFQRNPVGPGQFLPYFRVLQQRRIGDYGHGQSEFTQLFNSAPQVHIQGRLSVRHETQVINVFTLLGNDFHAAPDFPDYLPDRIEFTPFDSHVQRVSNLAICADVATGLGWNIINTQAATESPGRYRAVGDH